MSKKNVITAQDIKDAVNMLTEEELALPVVFVIDDEDEYLTVTTSLGFDKPLVKFISAGGSRNGKRINIVRV